MSKLIFLSHIHEESQLALYIQRAIEDEFSGFVEVFVSSDGKTIPAGANFLKRIETGLMDCVAALYLISPVSVKRNWVNFELGAVWIRNSISVKDGGSEIPTIPICHSGITPSTLPMPLVNLSAILASNSSQLESSFKSIQAAVGGKGKLKTDFDSLAEAVAKFEQQYTLGEHFIALFKVIGVSKDEMSKVIAQCVQLGKDKIFELKLGRRTKDTFQPLLDLETKELNGHIKVFTEDSKLHLGATGAIPNAEVTVKVKTDDIIDLQALLIKAII